nr:hypothetical protein [uncultured Cellulosilyticum sp.]
MDKDNVEVYLAGKRIEGLIKKRDEVALQMKNILPSEMPEYLGNSYKLLEQSFIEAIKAEARYLSSLK